MRFSGVAMTNLAALTLLVLAAAIAGASPPGRLPASTADAVPPGPSVAPCPVHVLSFGERGVGRGRFRRPLDIALDGTGDVYVFDSGNLDVQRFTANGSYVLGWPVRPVRIPESEDGGPSTRAFWGMVASGECLFFGLGRGIVSYSLIGEPLGRLEIDLDPATLLAGPDGTFLVTDPGASRIVRLGPGGETLAEWSPGIEGSRYGGLFPGPDGTFFLVVSEPPRVLQFSHPGGPIADWVPDTPESRYPVNPVDGAIAADGRVLISDVASNSVLVFSLTGEFRCRIGRIGTGPGEFDRPIALAAASIGIYVCDAFNARVQLFRPPETARTPVVWPAVKRWLESGGPTDPVDTDPLLPVDPTPRRDPRSARGSSVAPGTRSRHPRRAGGPPRGGELPRPETAPGR